MSKNDCRIKTDHGTFCVRQSERDVFKYGIQHNDLSRITVAGGNNLGGHFGTNSSTVWRHGVVKK